MVQLLNEIWLINIFFVFSVNAEELKGAEKKTEFNEFLKDKEDAVFFDDVHDLSKKIEYYKENKYEAIRIASNGYDKIHTYCNEKVVTSYFIDCINGKKEDMLDRYIWPIHFYE